MNSVDSLRGVSSTRGAERDRPSQALWLLLLMLAGALTLIFIATLTPRCGDGTCAPGESCAADCPPQLASAAPPSSAHAPAHAPAHVPSPAAPAPTPDPTPPPSPAPAPTPTPPPSSPPAPAAVTDEGRCAEPAFKALTQALVKDCERACKKDESPLVGLSPEAFGALFGRPDDAGVATHFAFFGCNRWAGDTCRGFDSAVADPAQCPASAATCPADAGALKSELLAFLDANRDAHTILLFGTASKAGNQPSAMSDANARLAETRAQAVAEVVHAFRRQVGARDMRVLSVALDNTRTDYWESPGFRAIMQARGAELVRSARTFSPLAADAANRSVMVVALKCVSLR